MFTEQKAPPKKKQRSGEEEVAARLAASATPAAFAQATSRGRWRFAPHLGILSRYLTDLSRRAGNYALLCSMPPRHGKSTLINQYFPVWYLGNHPDHQVGVFSYGASFASEWGFKARKVCQQYGPHYFGIEPIMRPSAANNWGIVGTYGEEYEGRMRTNGVGGDLTGRGFHLMVFDDLVKNSEEAMSPVMREKTYQWVIGTALTRLEPGGIVVGIGTRWNEDDWIGRLTADMQGGGKQWDVLNLPAIAEEHEAEYPYSVGRKPGEALWPERYPLNEETAPPEWKGGDTLELIQRIQGPYNWAALYQQRPAPLGGGLFKRDWFRLLEKAPQCSQYVRYWDLAASEKLLTRDPDYTVGVLMGRQGDHYIVLDVVRFQGNPATIERMIRVTAHRDGVNVPIYVEQEGGASGKNLTYHLATKVVPGFSLRAGETKSQSKTMRADPLSACAAAGGVYIVKAGWNAAYIGEMLVFPNGTHDDQVDASSGAFNILARGRPFSWGQAGERPNFNTYKPR